MANTIAEKIDFIMKLTNTGNTELARALSFDASYISRIRRGKRGLPPKQQFIEPAAAFLAPRIKEDYQKAAAVAALGLSSAWPATEPAAAARLAEWFNSAAPAGQVESLLAAMSRPAVPLELPLTDYPLAPGSKTEAALYYGRAGKRQAVIAFLSALCESGEAHTLLLHSDEDFTWLYEDPAFVRAWAALMIKLIHNGGRIKIIHTISRNTNEMWEALQKWLPLYLTGAIDPYYYPGLRDGVYHRTLFVAAGHSAVVATAVVSGEETINCLLRDKRAVQALEQEFQDYLALCRPLMEVARPDDLSALAPLLRAFLDAPGPPQAAFFPHMTICVKAEFGALVIKTDRPYAVYRLTEPRLIAAVADYLHNLPLKEQLTPAQIVARLQNEFAAGN